MQFRYDVNGLRAVAVLLVIIYHLDLKILESGYVGVDIFFVISGFLMTKIVIENYSNFNVRNFYISRFRRIVPPLAFLCSILLLWGWFSLIPDEYEKMTSHILSSLLFYSNFVYWGESGYFAASSLEKWLLHTWSLSVEWQFYMIYPLFLILVSRLFKRENIKNVIILTTLLAFFVGVLIGIKSPSASYFLILSRAWEMLIGGVAYFYSKPGKKSNYRIQRFSLALILISSVINFNYSYWPGYGALLPVVGAFFILVYSTSDNYISKSKLIQNIGSSSYSLYLWHWPLIVYFNEKGYVSWTHKLLLIAIIFIIGYLAYIAIEKGIGSLKLFKIQVVSVSVVILISLFFNLTKGADFESRGAANTKEANYLKQYPQGSINKIFSIEYRSECNFYDVYSKQAKVDIDASCLTLDKNTYKILLWGDSHAQALSYGIRREVLSSGVSIAQIATSSCKAMSYNYKSNGQLSRACRNSNEFASSYIRENDIDLIIVAQSEPEISNYNSIIELTKDLDVEKVIFLGPVPQWESSLPKIIVKRHFNSEEKVFSDPMFRYDLLLKDQKAKGTILNYNDEKYDYLSMLENLCEEDACLAKVDEYNTPLVWDKGHLTLPGSQFIASKLIVPYVNTLVGQSE